MTKGFCFAFGFLGFIRLGFAQDDFLAGEIPSHENATSVAATDPVSDPTIKIPKQSWNEQLEHCKAQAYVDLNICQCKVNQFFIMQGASDASLKPLFTTLSPKELKAKNQWDVLRQSPRSQGEWVAFSSLPDKGFFTGNNFLLSDKLNPLNEANTVSVQPTTLKKISGLAEICSKVAEVPMECACLIMEHFSIALRNGENLDSQTIVELANQLKKQIKPKVQLPTRSPAYPVSISNLLIRSGDLPQ